MAADYQGFVIHKEVDLGVPESVGAGVDVHVRLKGAMSDAAESPLTTDAYGEIPDGSIAAASPGDIAYFRIEDLDGLAQSVAQTLT